MPIIALYDCQENKVNVFNDYLVQEIMLKEWLDIKVKDIESNRYVKTSLNLMLLINDVVAARYLMGLFHSKTHEKACKLNVPVKSRKKGSEAKNKTCCKETKKKLFELKKNEKKKKQTEHKRCLSNK